MTRPAWVGWLLAAVFSLFVLAVTAGGITLVAWLVVQTASAVADTAAPVVSAVGGWGVTRAITAPVHDYFAAHVTVLPLSPDQLWRAWAAAGLGLLVLSWTGSFGARLGWTLIGAATTAMVHAATPALGVWVATGIAALTWGVLSIPPSPAPDGPHPSSSSTHRVCLATDRQLPSSATCRQ